MLRNWLISGSLALLSACAGLTPPPSDTAPPSEQQEGGSIAKRRQVARQYQQSGDLAAAATQWHILTLLAPRNDEYRHELASTRAAIARARAGNLDAGKTALRSGDVDRASQALLKVLALDPANEEAARILREIERQKIARIQAGRVARLRPDEIVAPSTAARAPALPAEPVAESDVDQRLELFNAGDTASGLRELRRFVDANPNDRAARQHIGAAVYERARQIESQGRREQALELYGAAVSLRGGAAPGWEAHMQSLRKGLANEYYEKGLKVYRTDVAAAIRNWETSVRYDPENTKAASRLNEARQAQDRLKRIEQEGTQR